MKTRTLLTLVFSLALILVIGRGIWSYVAFSRILDAYGALVARNDRVDGALQRVSGIAIDLETGVRGWLATGDPVFLEPYQRASADRPIALDDLERLEGPQGLSDAAARLRLQLDEWDRDVARPLIARDVFTRVEADRLALNRLGKQRMDAIRATLANLRAALSDARARQSSDLGVFQRRLLMEALLISVAAALFLIVLASITVRSIEAPLRTLVAHAERTARGEFGPVHVDGVKEARVLAIAMSDMAERLAEDRERERRFTAMVAALSLGGDPASIAAVSLRCLVDAYAFVGAVLWIAPDDASPLRLGASVAIDAERLPPMGDPVAREVRASKRAVLLRDLDQSASHVVRSALMDVVPRALYAAPVHADTRLIGVVELAGELDPKEVPEIERSLARIGLALQNALAFQRVEELGLHLETVNGTLREHNEELRAQEEELRAQEEELRAQSAELAAKQAELGQRNDELARASQAKSDFLSSMSHELRTPLNAVIGFADVLLSGSQGALPAQQKESVADILAGGRQLLTLVNDILDLSKIEAGFLEMDAKRFDLGDVAAEACSLLETLADRKHVTLENGVGAATFFCVADRNRVRQVFLNLVSNAIKFTPVGGSVAISAAHEAHAVRVKVTDTGIGISTRDTARLFVPFSQLDPGRAGGTGLGLSICKRLIDQMNGEIGLTSEPGKGSVFFFTLPLSDALVTTMPSTTVRVARSFRASMDGRKPRRILVVEDEPADARVAENVLARGGYLVHTVDTAEKALDAIRSDSPHLVVVDLGLPGMSGFALIDRVRAMKPRDALPIIVLTSRDLSADERELLAASTDLVAQKGMMTGAGFLDSVASLCGRHGPSADDAGRRVLVIDDSDVNRRVVKTMLAPSGYEVSEAADAETGIALARERAPDAILMDIRLPAMNGLDATRALAADPVTARVPVIALSAQAMVGDRESALAAGCVAYLAKPVGRSELLDVVLDAITASRERAVGP